VSDAARKTIDLPALSVRAAITPTSIDKDNRTIDVDFSTGAAVRRFDWEKFEPYIEKLSMKPEHVRLDRLNSRAPVLDMHDTLSGLKSQLGVVQPDSAKMTGRRGTATLRFSKRADVEPIWRDIEDGIIANVSVGYLVHRYEETPAKKGEIPTRLAVDWEPYEVSMVPMPADVGAQTRDGRPAGTLHPCTIDLTWNRLPHRLNQSSSGIPSTRAHRSHRYRQCGFCRPSRTTAIAASPPSASA
jgi:hypothetical protein